MMNKSYQLELFQSSIADYLRCADNDFNVSFKNVDEALKHPYVAPNNTSFINCLLFDIDRADAPYRFLDVNLPQPNIIVKNDKNAHAHYIYMLKAPVSRTLKARTAPIRYLARVQQAMTERLDADRAYTHFLTKTPGHSRWQTFYGRQSGFSLPELHDHLDEDLPLRISKQRAVGEGRNVNLFDNLRYWAYKNRLDYNSFDNWFKACLKHAQAINTFTAPLPIGEVTSTAKSVAKWTYKNITEKGFSKVQTHRSSLATAKRQNQYFERQYKLLLMSEV